MERGRHPQTEREVHLKKKDYNWGFVNRTTQSVSMQPSKQNAWMSSMCRLRTALGGRHWTLKERLWCFHHIGKGPDIARVPKDTIHTPQRVLAFQYAFNRGKSQSEVEPKVGMYDHSPRDRHQQCGTGSSSQVERIEDEGTDADLLFRRELSVLQQQKGDQKHLSGKATVHCVCPVSPIDNSQNLKVCFRLTVVK